MTDRELLEMAAKAAGIEVKRSRLDDPGAKDLLIFANRPNIENSIYVGWNPLTEDGDALRLAVKLKLDVSFGNRYYFDEGPMTFCGTYWSSGESATFNRFVSHGDDPYAATRRAIVRAAAEIGKEMK